MKHTREEKKEFYRKLFALVLPLALQNLMTALVSASDALMLGLLDQSSLSSVSLATQVQFVLNLFYAAELPFLPHSIGEKGTGKRWNGCWPLR